MAKEKTVQQMIKALLRGRRPEQVAVILQCSRSTVSAWAGGKRKPKYGWYQEIKRVYSQLVEGKA